MKKLDGEYCWTERWLATDGQPEGMALVCREMVSYQTCMDRFIPHLQAMAEGLTEARFTEYDSHGADLGMVPDDCYGIFVVGLRPLQPGEQTQAEVRRTTVEQLERDQLARLLAKYPDAVPT